MIKSKIKNLNLSATLKINEISNNLEKEGKNVIKFGFGQSPFNIPEDVINELKNNSFQNKYLPMQGLPELREAVANYISSKRDCHVDFNFFTDFKTDLKYFTSFGIDAIATYKGN